MLIMINNAPQLRDAMKPFKNTLFLLLGILIIVTSCRTENDVAIDPPVETALVANSTAALLMSKMALNDGSIDNIIDRANCLRIQLPVTVTVNGTLLVINAVADYETIEDIIDQTDNDIDLISISYPITVIRTNHTRLTVNNDAALAALAATCAGENIDDDDIECIDFQYPISASVFDINRELLRTVTLTNDNELYDFIDDLEQYTAVTLNFPITLILAGGTLQNISSMEQLENAITLAADSCDEDDDYDYDDDDCDSCTTATVNAVLTGCTNWSVSGLERNGNDLESNYAGYLFTFNATGTITVRDTTTTYTGTWSTAGTGNNITITLNITGLSDFNATWNLLEIEQEPGEAELDLKIGDDELSFESNC